MLKSQLRGENLFYHVGDPRFIYIANYKAAYTSILTSLLSTFPDLRAALWEGGLPRTADFSDHFVFSFVRNPVDRVRSCYFDKILISPERYLALRDVPPPQECQMTVYNACTTHLDRSASLAPPSRRQVLERLRELAFDEFVSLLPHVCMEDLHFYPQSLWLDKFLTLRARCFVGRVETFEQDWIRITELMNQPVPLLHENRTDYAHADADARLDARSRRTIEEVYSADYRDFYPEGSVDGRAALRPGHS